jgi:cytidylate kinase
MSFGSSGQGPRTLGTLVDHQVMAWRLRNQRERSQRPETHYMPAVTISRESSAFGADVARLLAKVLGFELWDEALVTRLAERAGAGEGTLRVVDERERGLIDDVLASRLLGAAVSSSTYRTLLERALHELGTAGAGVIVGRGANFVLPPEQAFRVRIVCPFEQRAARMAASTGKSRADAELAVQELDRERAGFVKQFCGKDPSDTSAYDLVVNTARLSVDEAAHVIAAAYRARYQPATVVLRRASIAARASLPMR